MIFTVAHTQGFVMIWRDECCRAIGIEVAQLGIDQHRHTLVRERQDLAQNVGRHHALIVVRNNKSICLLQRVFQTRDNLFFQFSGDGIA